MPAATQRTSHGVGEVGVIKMEMTTNEKERSKRATIEELAKMSAVFG